MGAVGMTSSDARTIPVNELPEITLEDIREEHGDDQEQLQGMSVWSRMLLSYRDMRKTTRALIEENPSEARLLVFVVLSDVIFFLARTLSLVVAPGDAASQEVPLHIGLILLGVFVLRTATLYCFSGFVGLVCRALGGKGSWRDTRTGVFWASLVASPIGVIGALIGAGFGHLEPYFPFLGDDVFVIAPLSIGIVAFVFFVSAGVAEAQKFRKTSPVFIAFSLLTIVLAVATIAVYARLPEA